LLAQVAVSVWSNPSLQYYILLHYWVNSTVNLFL